MLERNIILDDKTILVTGAAGFIGASLTLALLKSAANVHIVGIDNMNAYYDVALKEFRLSQIRKLEASVSGHFTFIKGTIADKAQVCEVFDMYKPQLVVNLAAQAGVRYSIENPDAYIESNLIGFYNILEACRHSYDNGASGVEHLVYASSSSVYGSNKKIPYATEDKVDNPVSLYAATKKSNELLAHSYTKLYGIPSTGLRFFTVYGPAGRPDMAYFGFTDKLVRDETIKIFNYGNCKRDFTYIDDIVESLVYAYGCNHQLINAANPEETTTLHFAELVKQYKPLEIEMIAEERDFDRKEQSVNEAVYTVPLQYTPVADGIRRIFESMDYEQTQ